jgi:hypothetical protein
MIPMQSRHPGAAHGGVRIMTIVGLIMVGAIALYMVQQLAELAA